MVERGIYGFENSISCYECKGLKEGGYERTRVRLV